MNKGVLAGVIFTPSHRACARRQWQLQRKGRQACKQEQNGDDGNIDEDVPRDIAHDGTAAAAAIVAGVLLEWGHLASAFRIPSLLLWRPCILHVMTAARGGAAAATHTARRRHTGEQKCST